MNKTLKDIKHELSTELCKSFSFHERQGKLHLVSPFYFDDGDGVYIVIIANNDGSFTISDQGNTLMRLSYGLTMDQLETGRRKEILEYLTERYGISDRIGEYRITANKENLIDRLFDMIQFQLRMEDSVFSVEKKATNTFIQDFQQKSLKHFSEHKTSLDWYDEEHDDEGQYSVDVLLKGKNRNLAVFPMHTSYNLLNNTVTIHYLRQWHSDLNFVGVVDDKNEVSNSNIRKFNDASDKLYYLNDTSEDFVFHQFETLLAS